MSLKDNATRVAVLKALHEAIGKELTTAQTATQDGLKVAKKETGTKQIAAELPGGVPVATITLVSPDPAATVTDDEAFLTWVRDTHPSEVTRRFVTEVRPAFVKALLKEMTAAGVAQWCDKDTGEVHDVPGVKLEGRSAYQRLTFGKTGRTDIAAAWASGDLNGLVLPELTAGGEGL